MFNSAWSMNEPAKFAGGELVFGLAGRIARKNVITPILQKDQKKQYK
jgi:hypothetical protein